MTSSTTLTAADRFVLTLDELCRAVAGRIAGGAMTAVMILMVWRRLKRIEGRILRLLARFQAGRLRIVVRSGAGGGRVGGVPTGLPRGFGWLLPLVPCEAANFASQMRGVLAEPDMVALLVASAQARRVLGPLCRMLGIEAAVLGPKAIGPGPCPAPETGGEAHGGEAHGGGGIRCALPPYEVVSGSETGPLGRAGPRGLPLEFSG